MSHDNGGHDGCCNQREDRLKTHARQVIVIISSKNVDVHPLGSQSYGLMVPYPCSRMRDEEQRGVPAQGSKFSVNKNQAPIVIFVYGNFIIDI